MTHLRLAAATIAVALMLAAVAAAKEEWKTVTLGGDPGFTVSIPAAVGDYGGGKDPDDLMFFSVEAAGHGALVCIAHRADYPKGVTQAAFAAALATERRKTFCSQDRSTISNLDIGDSKSFNHHGLQAAVCTASYTDSAQKMPGIVTSQMVLAAPDKPYVLTCNVEDEDQELAEYEWATLWGDKVRHIQDSFHLPK